MRAAEFLRALADTLDKADNSIHIPPTQNQLIPITVEPDVTKQTDLTNTSNIEIMKKMAGIPPQDSIITNVAVGENKSFEKK